MPGGTEGDDVSFMFKAMLERDPNKRRVKPVQNQLLEAAFGYDSSDDSDFNVDEASGSSGTDGSDAESKASEGKEEKKSKGSESEDSEEDEHGKQKEAAEDKSTSDSDQKDVARKRDTGAKGKQTSGWQQSKASGEAAKKTSSGESESSDSESAASAKDSNDAEPAKDQKRKWNFRRKRSTPAVMLTEQDLGNMDDYDSEDDNDWDPQKVGKQGDDSESEGSDGKGDGGNDNSDSGDSSDKDSKGSEDGSDDEEEDEDGDEKDSAKSEEQESGDDASGSESTVDKSVTIGELIEKVAKKRTNAEESVTSSKTSGGRSSQKMQEVLICSVCLGENSEDSNEIVQCDSCGVTVHEACYGVDGESESVISSTSDNSTEPWFCDPCKAGVVPSCELCPATDGIFKETDAGRWVHVVCALYVSGVAFEDVERLRPVTLTEMSYAKYGAKECMMCEERLFSRTGVCINCDAGMCRSFFHVTCAQSEGLLSEAAAEEEIADPFFAHCKQHADRMDRKWKRKNYLALQSFSRHIREEKGKAPPGDIQQARIDAKLQLYRARFELAKGTRPSPWVPREKLARPLTSSASAVRALLRKAQLAGVSMDIMPADTTEPGTGDGRRKQIRHPTLTADFVTYYLERNMQMMQIQENICDQRKLKNELQKQEEALRASYGGLMETLDTMKSLNNKLQREGHTLWTTLAQITGQKLTQPLVLRVQREQKSSLMKAGQEAPLSLPQILHSCGICEESSDQHLLTQCDTCQRYYHLGCLDPPLTRMPRRSKNSYWQCSECDRSGSSSSDGDAAAETLLDSMKRSRRQVREPVKFTQLPDSPTEDKRRRKRGRKRKAKEEEIEEEKPKVCPKTREPRHLGAKKPKAEEQQIQCTTCGSSGNSDTTVRCDQCTLNYHFGCLNPPLKKSPKQFGYGWICQDCDSTPSEDDDNDEDQKEEENGAKRSKEESTSLTIKKSL